MEKSCRKSTLKASTFEIWYITQNTHWMQEILSKISSFETGLSKSLKIVNFIFSFEPSPFSWTKLSKTNGTGTSDQSLFRLWNKFRKITLLVMCYLTKFDDVTWSKRFFQIKSSYSKIYICKSVLVNSRHLKLFHFFVIFNMDSVERKEKIQKLVYLENEKSVFDEIKYIFL